MLSAQHKVWSVRGALQVLLAEQCHSSAIGCLICVRARRQVPSMMDGGALWFPNLTVADPTYALPVLTSLTFLATVELGAADGMQGQSADMLKNLKNFMRGLAVVMVPFSASLPAVRAAR
jgi:hypothetical protein